MHTTTLKEYILDIKKQHLTLEGVVYTQDNIEDLLKTDTNQDTEFRNDLYAFLADWFNESPTITLQTSGSTGNPKKRTVRKEQMMQSAIMTCSFLNLQKGDRALLCMPLLYVGGKMMVVRSLVAGLNLVIRTPSGHPMAGVNIPFRFAAMIPLQVYNTLQVTEETERLKQIDILIIGGSAIDNALEKQIRELPNSIYSTYGMTETLSHIALRKINGKDRSVRYIPFPSVNISLSQEQTLTIHAPCVCDNILETNDIAQIFPDGSFSIIGRKDNVVNSGGVKIQIEQVEKALNSIISCNFAITSIPDPKFGEVLILLIEKEEDIAQHIKEILPKYQQPKRIYKVESIPYTGNGKINRPECRKLAIKLQVTNNTI
ncbi:AMP-binding protein [Parabacteroides chinchillae]